MAISVLLKAFTRRAQLPCSLSSYESVFRNVNSPTSSLPSKTFTSLGGRSCCSKPDHSCPVAQNQTKSNLRKVVFKYVCVNDESQEASRPVKPIIRKVLEIPSGVTFFEDIDGDDVNWCYLRDFLQSYIVRLRRLQS
ncbi:uncharacterized protein LOC113348929 [Papaver somniferum]|uniref:uncharacterized protein LOC113348929 n=1 Tax=Papaver somniferum TaxID=3469 RepID=UPI000E705742|nr:uncharacterized protein LOC113348929 [Papaver somniferum]